MNTLKKIADQFIQKLQERNVNNLDDDTKKSQSFIYFRSISGFINNMYFDVHFIEHEQGIDIKMSPTTDCKLLIKGIIGSISTEVFVYTRRLYHIG